MKHLARSAALTVSICLLVLAAAPAFAAGPYTDELSKCLVRSTTEADKTLLVQWMFAMAALHPGVKWMASVTDAQRAELNKKTAGLFERLLTKSCLSETREALKYEGESTIEASFSVLGQVASRELFANPSVAAGLAELGKNIDETKMRKTLGLTN